MSGEFPVDAGRDSCGGADSCVPGRLGQSLPALWILPRDGFATGDSQGSFLSKSCSCGDLGSIPVCLTCRENKAGMSSDGWMSPGPFLGQGMCWWGTPGRAEQGTEALAPLREHLPLFQG